MIIFKPMVGIGILLIAVGIYGVYGIVEQPADTPFPAPRRGYVLKLILSKFGQDFGQTGGMIALVIGGVMVVAGTIGWYKSRNEPEEPGFFS